MSEARRWKHSSLNCYCTFSVFYELYIDMANLSVFLLLNCPFRANGKMAQIPNALRWAEIKSTFSAVLGWKLKLL